MSLLLRIAVLMAFLCLLFAQGLDLSELGRSLGNFSLPFGLLVGAVVMIDRWLMTYKWTLLLNAQGHRLPISSGMTIYCSSMLWGAALPATVGSDTVRAVLAVKRGIGATDVTASIIVERMIGFLATLMLALVSLVLLQTTGIFDDRYDPLFYSGALLLLAALSLVAICANATVFNGIVNRLPGRIQASKPVQQLGRLAHAYHMLEAARGPVIAFTLLTFIEQSFAVTVTWILAAGFGLEVDFLVLLAVVPIATLVSRFPVSIDGLGLYESAFAALMSLTGMTTSDAVAIALTGRAIQLLCLLPWWLVQVVGAGHVRPPQPA